MKYEQYSIGEVAKLTNLSIQTLRYYDQIDLFKPAFVDPVTNYRYYSDGQLYHLDLIKTLKHLGTPLNKIKEAQNLTPEQLLQFLQQQEEVLENNIRTLQIMQDGLRTTKKQMEEQLAINELEVVYEKIEQEQKIIKIKTDQLTPIYIPNAYYSSLKKIIEGNGAIMNNRYGGIFPFGHYSSVEQIYYDAVFTPIFSDIRPLTLTKDIELSTIYAGRYACIAFLFSNDNYLQQYNKLQQYILKNNLDAEHDVYEIYIPNNYSPQKTDEFIVELKIRLK